MPEPDFPDMTTPSAVQGGLEPAAFMDPRVMELARRWMARAKAHRREQAKLPAEQRRGATVAVLVYLHIPPGPGELEVIEQQLGEPERVP